MRPWGSQINGTQALPPGTQIHQKKWPHKQITVKQVVSAVMDILMGIMRAQKVNIKPVGLWAVERETGKARTER